MDQREMGGATSAAEITERRTRAGGGLQWPWHYCVAPLGKNRFGTRANVASPDGRVVVVLISRGGNTRDKILRPSSVHRSGTGRDSGVFEPGTIRGGPWKRSR